MLKESSSSVKVSFRDKTEVITKLKTAIQNTAHKRKELVGAILFGSFAADRYSIDSDLDLLLVVKHAKHLPPFRSAHYHGLLTKEIDMPMDILVWTVDEVEMGRQQGHGFLRHIETTGIQLL